MKATRQTQKKYASRAMLAAIFVSFGLVLAGHKPMAKGLILGTLFSILNFIIIAETLPLRIHPSQRRCFAVALGSILLRFTLMAIPLIVAIKWDAANVFAVIPGLLMIQLVIVFDHLNKNLASNRASGV